MSYTAGVLLLVAGVAVVILALLQVLQYRRGGHIITRGQLLLRLTTAVVLLGVIGLIFYGVLKEWPSPLQELLFYCLLMLLAVVVIFLALADLRILEYQRHIHQAKLYRAVQQAQDDSSRKEED